MTFGEAVHEARLENDWTLDDLAAASGVAKGTLSVIERGANTTLSTMRAIVRALGWRLDTFFADHEVE